MTQPEKTSWRPEDQSLPLEDEGIHMGGQAGRPLVPLSPHWTTRSLSTGWGMARKMDVPTSPVWGRHFFHFRLGPCASELYQSQPRAPLHISECPFPQPPAPTGHNPCRGQVLLQDCREKRISWQGNGKEGQGGGGDSFLLERSPSGEEKWPGG